MKQLFTGMLFVALFAVTLSPALVQAHEGHDHGTTDVSSSLDLLQSLLKQVEDLQKQLAALQGQVKQVQAELKDGLREGVTDEDVKKIQELLATDPTIYPKGLVSGFYGPLTKDAVKAFQKRHGIVETGEVDADTKALILEYFKENGGKVPPGLLRAPGIDKKILDRFKRDDYGKYYLDCDDKRAAGVVCKDKYNGHGHDKNEHDDHGHESEEEAEQMEEAEDMIEAAEEAIEDLEAAIEEAKDDDEDEDDIEDAEDELARAEAELAEAKDLLEDKKYEEALDEATKAKMSAFEGMQEID